MARRISIGTLVIMLLVLGLSPVVHGQTVWTHVASACMVDEADLNDFAASNGYVYFKSGVTGSMYLRCTLWILGWWSVSLLEHPLCDLQGP